jgi:hypothetical protein
MNNATILKLFCSSKLFHLLMVFSLLARTTHQGSVGEKLILPLRFSNETQNRLSSCQNLIIISITGKSGLGKTTLLNCLIRGRRGQRQGPFKCGGGGRGKTHDFDTFGPISLADFCRNLGITEIPTIEYNLIFVDSEGTAAAHGMDRNLAKALAAISSIATIGIVMGQNRLHDDTLNEVERIFELQCFRGSGVASAIALVCRSVGFDDPAPMSLQEMESRRHLQDQEGFELVCGRFPRCGFTSENLCILQQPQTEDGDGPVQFGPESYMESIRDLGRFIIQVCSTRSPMGFPLIHSVFLTVANLVNSMTIISPVNMDQVIENLWISTANEIAGTIRREYIERIQQQIERMTLVNFPFDGSINPPIDEAIRQFTERCNRFSQGFLENIQTQSEALRVEIRGSLTAEWNRQFEIRRAFLIVQLTQQLIGIGERLAYETSTRTLNEVNGLVLSAIINYTSAEQFCRPAIRQAEINLAIAAQAIHAQYEILVPDALQIARARIQNEVRSTIDDRWQQRRAEADRWQAERNAEERRTLERQAEQRCQAEIRQRQEAERLRLQAEQQANYENAQRLREEKTKRPKTLSDIVEIRGSYGLVGNEVWINAGGMAGLPFIVVFWSARESQLEFTKGMTVKIWKKRVTRVFDQNEGYTIWTVTAELGLIESHIDGSTMEIVFKRAITLGDDEAIYIDLPMNTDIVNVESATAGFYQHWIERPNNPKYQVIMGVPGTYARGPRIQAEHY